MESCSYTKHETASGVLLMTGIVLIAPHIEGNSKLAYLPIPCTEEYAQMPARFQRLVAKFRQD